MDASIEPNTEIEIETETETGTDTHTVSERVECPSVWMLLLNE